MSENNKTVWSEGMFLRPQHFQQQERYLQTWVKERCGGLQPYDWGIKKLTVDTRQLSLGKFALTECSGIFPDGTPFRLPEDDDLPLPIEIPLDVENSLIYLALPVHYVGAVEVNMTEANNQLARYHASEEEVRDYTLASNNTATVLVAKLHTGFRLEKQECAGYLTIGVARVIESRNDKTIVLDNNYIPPCIDCNTMPLLHSYLQEIQGLLHTRGEAVAGRLIEAGKGGVAQNSDILLLQLINRIEPLLAHLQTLPALHPERFYRYALQWAGELATFYTDAKRPLSFSPYLHEDLSRTFDEVMNELRRLLSTVLEQTAIQIPLIALKFGLLGAQLTDSTLIKHAVFIIAAKAQVPLEKLRNSLPSQIKIAPAEYIQTVVNSALPGISIQVLPATPRQIPYHQGFVYFELNQSGDYWKKMEASGGFAIQTAGDFPGLELEFWAIKRG